VVALLPDDVSARHMLHKALFSGAGLKKFAEMIEEQGGDPIVVKNPDMLCRVDRKIEVKSKQKGYIDRMNAEGIGLAAMALGAGREKKTDKIDPAVGLILHRRIGSYVDVGDILATLYVNDGTRLTESMDTLLGSIMIGNSKPKPSPIVYDVIKK
jgi:pyrimidine-nucleoside phosphorylase